jgi:hypothetical protein
VAADAEEIEDEVYGTDEVEVDDGAPGLGLSVEGLWGELELKVFEYGGFAGFGLTWQRVKKSCRRVVVGIGWGVVT